VCEKSRPPTGIRFPDRPARSQSLYRLSYPGPHYCRYVCKIGKVIHLYTATKTLLHWVCPSPDKSVAALAEEFPRILRTRTFVTVFAGVCQWILSWPSLIRPISYKPLSSISRFPTRSFSLRFWDGNFVCNFFSPIQDTWPTYHIIVMIPDEEHNLYHGPVFCIHLLFLPLRSYIQILSSEPLYS
jgi:hypothetical protein